MFLFYRTEELKSINIDTNYQSSNRTDHLHSIIIHFNNMQCSFSPHAKNQKVEMSYSNTHSRETSADFHIKQMDTAPYI